MTEPYDSVLEEEATEREKGRHWPRWLALLLGLGLGLGAGLFYTWILNPVQYYNTDPVDLRPQHKETWILLAAAAYRQDGDLDRALDSLSGLQDPHIGQTVADLTESAIRAGKPATRIRALAALADALGARTDEMMIYLATPAPTLFYTPTPPPPTPTPTPTATPTDTPTPTAPPTDTPTPTPTPTPTDTPRPTVTRRPTATRPPPYVLERRQRICQPEGEVGRIEVIVQTEEGAGIPGTEIWVTWTGGVDRFITGLKPELGLGFADFDMSEGVVYAVSVGDPTQQVIDNLRAESCQTGGGDDLPASWRLFIVATGDAFTPTPSPTATTIATPTRGVTPTRRPTTTPTGTPTRRPTSAPVVP